MHAKPGVRVGERGMISWESVLGMSRWAWVRVRVLQGRRAVRNVRVGQKDIFPG